MPYAGASRRDAAEEKRIVRPGVFKKAISQLFCLLIFTAPHAYAARSTASVTDPAYASAQRLVNVDHGRRLNIYCIGKGSPTVIFDAGLGNWSQIWGLVQPVIAKRTRACAYDRAGLGFSDAATREGSSANIVDDLHRLLRAAQIEPPYVLVGHSYGGMSMRLYADVYRDDVVGMVLVDPSAVDLAPPRSTWAPDVAARAAAERATVEQHTKTCLAAAETGFVPGTAAYKECVSEGLNPRYSAAINAVYGRLQKQTSFLKARWSEEVAFDGASAEQVRAAQRSYGAMPLIVLTQSDATKDPANAHYLQAHKTLAALSSRGVQRVVPDSSHDIFFDQPQAVIDAIEEVLDAIGKSPR